jgi:hypothetical protein
MSNNLKHLLRASLATACFSVAASAQTITGSVSGIVTDATGAVVPGATVTATNVDTGVKVTDTTNSAGIYNIRFLQIGKYKVTTAAKGFQAQSFGPFALEIDQIAKVDVKLTVGSDTTTVNVTSGVVPLLDTDDSVLATTLTANTIENIPLNGRNWSSLTLFVPGAVATSVTSFGGSGNANVIERNQSGGGVSQANVNGNRAEGNNYLLDGMEINETLNNLVGYNPNPDAIAELQVVSANAPAEYGNVNGGDILANTKSGTNQIHGSVSGFLQDYKLDANTWSNKHQVAGQALPKSHYTQSQYSGTLGGPIIKDKLFAFGDYFGTRYHAGGLQTASVLSALMRQGDFSELLNPGIMGGASKEIQLYDPYNNYKPYANNQGVPITNPVVQYLIAHPSIYPLPNLTPVNSSPVSNNFEAPYKSDIYNNQFDIKVDYTPTSKDRISARWLQGTSGDSSVKPLAVAFPSASTYPDKGIALNYVRTITPAIVNEFRAGFTRIRWNQGNPNDTTGLFGTKGNSVVGINAPQSFQGFAGQSISASNVSLTSVGNDAGGTNFVDNTFLYGDDLTWQRGKHLLKAGVQFLRYQQNYYYPGNDGADGYFDFGNNSQTVVTYTSNPTASAIAGVGAQGYGAADWLLDRAAFAGIGGIAGFTGQRQWRSAYFVQDDWKLRSNLTVNIGLRYEYFQPIYEVHNKEVNVNLDNGTLEFPGSVPAGQPAGSTVCPTRSCINTDYNNFMPRLGFSWQPQTKLVVRGGFGITKALEGTGANLRLTYNPPFQTSFEAYGQAPSTTGTGNYFQVTNGFTNPAVATGAAGFYRADAPDIKPQQTNEYSLGLEYQLSNTASVRLGYIGEQSSHLVIAMAGNQLTAPCVYNGVVQTNPTANAATTAACSASDPAPYQSLVGFTGAVFETRTVGIANYNALQAQYRQRVSHGLEFTVNYAYARAMTDAVGFFGINGINGPSAYAQNAYDNNAEYGPAGSDVRNSLNGTAVYALPFGRGQQFGSNFPKALDEVIGGWKASMTAIAYSGLPVTITGADEAGTNNKTSRPNQISDLRVSHHSLNDWFGGLGSTGGNNGLPSNLKYAQAAAGTYGNAAVGTERAPGFQQYDFSFFKDFAVFHEQKLGFRTDLFNAFNQTSLGNPNSDSTSANFGQITSVKSQQRQIQFSAKYQF